MALKRRQFLKYTEEGFLFAAKQLKLEMSDTKREQLMQAYLALKPWPDVKPALKSLRDANIRLASLSCSITRGLTRISNTLSAPIVPGHINLIRVRIN